MFIVTGVAVVGVVTVVFMVEVAVGGMVTRVFMVLVAVEVAVFLVISTEVNDLLRFEALLAMLGTKLNVKKMPKMTSTARMARMIVLTVSKRLLALCSVAALFGSTSLRRISTCGFVTTGASLVISAPGGVGS